MTLPPDMEAALRALGVLPAKEQPAPKRDVMAERFDENGEPLF